MAKQKLPAPRIEFKKNKRGEFNFKIIGRNGKVLIDNKQGYKRKAGMLKNIGALHSFFKSSNGADFTIIEK